jgi:uncharacterized membrane protein
MSVVGALRSRAVAGVVIVVPIVVTILALGFVFRTVDGLLGPWIAGFVGRSVPGLGIVATVLLVMLTGTVATNFIGRRFIRLAERVFTEVPIVRRVYGASKDIVESATLSRTQAFRDVVMVEFPRRGVYSYGFVTSYSARSGPSGTQRLANVFVPSPPVPTSGALVAVPVEELFFVDVSVEDALKLVLSAGVAAPPELTERAPDRSTPSGPIG